MTRKRYIKLLMACGFDRNSAEGLARCAREILCRSYRADAESWERVYRDMALHTRSEFVRGLRLTRTNIFRRALYGEVAHE